MAIKISIKTVKMFRVREGEEKERERKKSTDNESTRVAPLMKCHPLLNYH